MAKKMKKIIVVALILVMSVSQLGMSSTGGQQAQYEVSVDLAQNAPGVSGNVTGTDTSTVHDERAGEIKTTTTTTSKWSGTSPSGATITGSGTETEFVSHDDYNGMKLYEGGTDEGQETESVLVESPDTDEKKDVVIDETNDPFSSSSSTAPVTDVQETDWVQGGLIQDNDWVEGALQEGQFQEDKSKATSDETREAAQIDEPENVKINLTPGKSKTVTKTVTVSQVVNDNVNLPNFGSSTSPITDADGKVIGEETVLISPVKNAAGDITGYERTTTTTHYAEPTVIESTPRENIVDNGSKGIDPGLPAQYQPGTEDILDAEGNVVGSKTTQVVSKTDAAGNVVGYTVTITTVTNDVQLDITQSAADTTKSDAQPNVRIELPTPPQSSSVTENGIVTDVIVSEIKNSNGDVIGYEITTVKTEENTGRETYRFSEKKYGTVITDSQSTTTDPTKIGETTSTGKTTVETIEIDGVEETRDVQLVSTRLNEYVNEVMVEKEYDFVEIDGKLYFIYTGNMSVTEGKNHGDTSGLIPVSPQSKYVSGASSSDDLYYKKNAGSGNYSTSTNSGNSIPDDGFKLIGNGMASNLVVGTAKGSTIVHQFKLKSDDGTVFYAYCVDMATDARPGYFYDIKDISSQNYYQSGDDAVEKIRSIALNGFWGNSSGVGSMNAIEELVKNYLVSEKKMSASEAKAIADELTPGQAVAATQAALWKYGSKSSSSRVDESDLLKYYYNNGGYNSLSNNSDDYKYTEYIYKALLEAADEPVTNANQGVEMLDKEDVKAGSITVNNKVETNAANTDANENNDVYSTDLSFTLGIEPAKLGGDLKVTVKVGNKVVRTARLDTADSFFSIGIDPDGNGVYTIKNVELAEGVVVNINISGTQDLGTGVYIYASEYINEVPSQTMVGLAKGERSVDLNISMNFNVTDPQVVAVSGESYQQGVVEASRLDTQTDVRQDSKQKVSTTSSSATEIAGNINTKYYADVTVNTLNTSLTVTERSWKSSWLRFYEPDLTVYNDDGGWDEDEDDDDKTVTDVPKTGDSTIWLLMISLGSLAGLLVLRRKKEEA